MNKILVICGPTATGKTSLGIRLAKKFNGEIVSADSRQVYQGMDIATGKDLPRDAKLKIKNEKLQIKIKKSQVLIPYRFKDIPVWMLDIAKPNQEFSVAQYINLAQKVISNIWERKKLPIVVGGTGFYIKGLIDGIETLGIPPDWNLRKNLENFSANELFEMLARLDSGKAALMNASDRKNPRRLIRAIEIAIKKTKKKEKLQGNLDALLVGLRTSFKWLYQRIDKRIDKQVKIGAQEEIERLLGQGYTWDLPAMTAMGYRVWKPYFEKLKSAEEVIKKWKYEEHAYARRQMTWFRKEKRIHWFDITSKSWIAKVELLVRQWYNADAGVK